MKKDFLTRKISDGNDEVSSKVSQFLQGKNPYLIMLVHFAGILIITLIAILSKDWIHSRLTIGEFHLIILGIIFILIGLAGNYVSKKQVRYSRHITELTSTIQKGEALKAGEERFRTLNRMISEMIVLKDLGSIYKFIVKSLHKRFPDTIILYISVDEDNRKTTFETVSGLESNFLSDAIKISGFNPLGINYNLTTFHYEMFKPGKLVEFEGGLAKFTSDEFLSQAAENIEKVLGINKIYTIGIIKDDKILAAIHFFTFKNRILDDKDFIEAFVSQAAIIIQKKIAEMALKESEERLQTIVEGSLDAIIAVNEEGRIVVFNGQAQVLFQFTEAEAVNQLVMLILRQEIGEVHQVWLHRYLNKGMGQCGHIGKREEKIFRKKDGSLFTAEVSMAGSRKDNLRLIVLSVHDITERKLAEQALKDSEKRLRESERTARILINTSERIAILISTADFTILDINEFGAFSLGSNSTELKGKNLFEFLPDDNAGTRQKKIKHSAKTSESLAFQDEIFGKFYYNHIYPILNDFGDAGRLAIFAQEITEIKMAEEKLKQLNTELNESNATKDKLFSIIAHDLRSPFNSILGFSELLEENFRNSNIKKAELCLGQINASAKLSVALLDNLLAWARMQSGKFNFQPESVMLNPVIQEVMDTLNSSALLKNISLNVDAIQGLECFTDVNMLKTILRNLIQNSIKFTHSGGRVDVSVIRHQDHVDFSVRDNGIGMSEDVVKMLFIKEHRNATMGTSNEPGSGLGLILCKEFIEKHGGKLTVESTAGKGSEFRFSLAFPWGRQGCT